MNKTFAPDTPRDDQGRLMFPPDNKRRRELFVPESFEHPARAQLFMIEALVEYLSEPGDTVVDPFGGSGTLLVGVPMARLVGLIELSDSYFELCKRNAERIMCDLQLSDIHRWTDGMVMPSLHCGPNQELLPNFQGIQAFIFSPPYAGALASAGGKLADWGGYTREHTELYADTSQVQGNLSPFNLGGFSDFMFQQEMKKIYRLCFDALKPGGFAAVIIKDRIRKGVKVELGYRTMQDMMTIGYEVYDWQRTYMAGSHYTKWHRSKGTKVIDEEHILMMQKPL